jgi:hypothetical protein
LNKGKIGRKGRPVLVLLETNRYVEAKSADAKCLSRGKPPKSKRSIVVLKDAKRRSLDDVVR